MPRLRYFVTLRDKTDRIRIDFETEYGRVNTIHIVQYEIWHQDNWEPIARYDMAHGFFHRDVYTFRGAIKYRIFIQDLGQALTFAIQDLKTNWKQYWRWFQGGRE